MPIEQIKEIVEFLPTLFIYIVPGYIILWIINYISFGNADKDKQVIFKSLILSYLLLSGQKFIHSIILELFNKNIYVLDTDNADILTIIITLVLAVLAGYFVPKIYRSKLWGRLLSFLKINASTHRNIWSQIIDIEDGNWVNVYIPSGSIIYRGHLRTGEINRKDNCFIALSNFTSIDSRTGEILDDYQNDSSKWVVVNTKDINRIEVFYRSESDENNSESEIKEEQTKENQEQKKQVINCEKVIYKHCSSK